MKRETAKEMIDYLNVRKVGKKRDFEESRKLETSQAFTEKDKNKLIYDILKYISFLEDEVLNLKFIAD